MIPPGSRSDETVGDGGERIERSLDSTLKALANERRRRILYVLREHDGVLDEEELARSLAAESGTDRNTIHAQLHHSDLPRLDECGLVEYNHVDGVVRYAGGSTVTDLVGTIAEYE